MQAKRKEDPLLSIRWHVLRVEWRDWRMRSPVILLSPTHATQRPSLFCSKREMLDFCADHGITADIELIKIQQINDAYERLLKSDVKYRVVIDMASLKA
jgi:uncharacterized zinc-type alcohol dehydrogenase-like protein